MWFYIQKHSSASCCRPHQGFAYSMNLRLTSFSMPCSFTSQHAGCAAWRAWPDVWLISHCVLQTRPWLDTRPHIHSETETNWQLELIRQCSTHSACRLEAPLGREVARRSLVWILWTECKHDYHNVFEKTQLTSGAVSGLTRRVYLWKTPSYITGNAKWIQKKMTITETFPAYTVII